MLPSFTTFKDEIEQIQNYMKSINCYNQILAIDISKSRDLYRDKIIELQKVSNKFNKRKYDYAIIIITLYGSFEQYIESFVKDYLMLLVDDCKEYVKLPEHIKSSHLNLSILLMGKIEQSKYNRFLTKEQIIKNLNDCIQHNKCLLNYDAFCQHTSNFRIQTIIDVLRNIGLQEVVNSIKQNEELKIIYIKENGECTYEGLKLETVFSFLNDLAERRNQIAHGSFSDILSWELQLDMINRVKLFVEEMDKIGFEEVLPYLVNKSFKIDKVYNPNKATKLLCFQFNVGKISVGDIVIKKYHDKYTYCRIESIEINHVKYNKYEASNKVDIGIMLDKCRKQDEEYWVYTYINS